MCIQAQFQLAMQLVGGEFTERVREYKDTWLPARTIVQKAIDSRLQVNVLLCVYSACCWVSKNALPVVCNSDNLEVYKALCMKP